MTSSNLNRRRFLLLAGSGLAVGGAAYTYARGVRFPLLHFAGAGPVDHWSVDGIGVVVKGAVFQSVEPDGLRLRAFVPEPEVKMRGDGRAAMRIVLENLHPNARLTVNRAETGGQSVVEEQRDNLTRTITVKPTGGNETGISWRFPNPERYRFAAIGDSGGGTELRWVLKRASALGADFLIHLGDIYYEKGDFDRASINLNTADIPTYAAIGDHDFSKGWRALYPKFHRLIGPSNWVFSLGGVEFVNFDTAAHFFPTARGRRAQILQNLAQVGSGDSVRDRVAVTHTPLSDPDPERNHALSRPAAARWLRERLLASGTRRLLAGNIHIKAEFDDRGLHTYIAGQGLAHADLIVDRPYAEILVGDVEPGQTVRYQWKPLNMPVEAHCSARIMRVLDALERPELKARLRKLCS